MKAFPTSMNEGYPQIIQGGMDLRDWFAGQVLPTLIGGAGMENITKAAYKWADAMMKARENKDE